MQNNPMGIRKATYYTSTAILLIVHDLKPYGGMEVQLHSFLAFALDWNDSLPAPTALSPRSEEGILGVHWWEPWWTQSQYETLGSEQFSCPYQKSNHDSSVDQNVAYHYTEHAIPGHASVLMRRSNTPVSLNQKFYTFLNFQQYLRTRWQLDPSR